MSVERKAGVRRRLGFRFYVTVGGRIRGSADWTISDQARKGVPTRHIYQVVRSGQSAKRGGRAAIGACGRRQDRIPPMRISDGPGALPPAWHRCCLVFEDEHLLVVDKPAGMGGPRAAAGSHLEYRANRAARPDQPFLELRTGSIGPRGAADGKYRRALLQMHAMLRQGRSRSTNLALWRPSANDRQHVKLARPGRGRCGR